MAVEMIDELPMKCFGTNGMRATVHDFLSGRVNEGMGSDDLGWNEVK